MFLNNYDNPSAKSKSFGLPASLRIFTLFSMGVFCLLLVYVLLNLSPVASKGNARDLVVCIPHQATAGQVGKILQQNELVKNSLLFTLYTRYKNLDAQIKAGEYLLNNGLSTPELLQELVVGRMVLQSFTIPEGFTTGQLADLLVSKGLIDREKFFSAIAGDPFSFSFMHDLPEGNRRLEGYLFPDTYQVTRGSSEGTIIEMMLKRFEKELNDLDYYHLAGDLGITVHQAVTIASMVEREARVDYERPIIAGVIHNRIKRSMPLQIDATVQYALGTNKPKIYYKDLEIDSPYNTYRVNGLPPGPIAMPGKASLMAAVLPDRTEYLYYVAKPDGTHAFATTLAEHTTNQARYQQ